MIKCETVREELSLEGERRSSGVQSEKATGLCIISALYRIRDGGAVREAKGFGSLFFQVMNRMGPAY